MSESLLSFQAAFAHALTGRSNPPQALNAPTASVPLERRFEVYRNNVYSSLISALAATFPVVERLVGNEFFRATARTYLEANMPARATLLGFGEGFPEFLRNFPPTRSLPYLCDVARLELLYLEAYHSADDEVLLRDDIAQIGPERFAEKPVALHASLRWIESDYPVVDIWQTNREDARVKSLKIEAGSQAWIALRIKTDVVLHRVPSAATSVLAMLRDGATLSEAIGGLPERAASNIPALLSKLIDMGVFSRSSCNMESRHD